MQRKAFTLVEILVVVGIIALVFSIGFPGMKTFSKQIILSSSAKVAASSLRALQQRAVAEHQTLVLDLNRLNLPPGIVITQSRDIKFAASGFPPPGGSGSLILKNQLGQIKKIIVSSAGRVRVE
jgi:prepilin-type N-terminal cleavage/methylation domain-containing protein